MSLIGLTTQQATLTSQNISGVTGTTLNIPGGYTAPYLMVSKNGSRLQPGIDFTAINGTTATLTSAAISADVFTVDAFGLFDIANPQFSDAGFGIYDEADPANVMSLDVSALTADRTITVPNASGTMVLNTTAGTVLQVVNATYGTQVSSTSSAYADTGLTATITPGSTSSKILVFVNQNGCGKSTSDTSVAIKLLRGSTDIQQISAALGDTGSTSISIPNSCSTTYLDSPVTASAVTYKTQFASRNNTGTVYVQWAVGTQPISTITLMEIAG